ncbi:hypothetical protein SS50377_24438 [Spironucleus salmonicida]|uniref:Uncharacterized protein n=1 Tax=Spironucleus salmonicida TaxID=348837 RepID=A0A9P8LUA1_9EUKA|nr:hypothetical protein SS50377_24438 [Spironucleus salmonicida]
MIKMRFKPQPKKILSPLKQPTRTPIQLAVVSKQAINRHITAKTQQVDTVFIEDIYRHIGDDPTEQLLDITKFTTDQVNPIQRNAMFRMPGKRQRDATSHFGKFKINTQCLCQKYQYNRIKDHLLRLIDKEFSILEEKFAYKMQKSLAKQLDISLFLNDVNEAKSFLKLEDKELMENMIQEIVTTCERSWEGDVKRAFLNSYSLQEQINVFLAKFEIQSKSIYELHENAEFFCDDYLILLQKTRLSLLSPIFVDNFTVMVDQAQKLVYQLEEKYTRINKNIQGRFLQHQKLEKQIEELGNWNI